MKRRPAWILLSLLLLATQSLPAQVLQSERKKGFEVSRNFDILHALFRELDQFYVDTIAPSKALKNSIDGLMSTYDPYTTYMEESETDDLKFLTTGEYGGIGALIGNRNNKVFVLEPYENMPAQKAGLMAGDELLEIGGVSMTGENRTRASELLKGRPGTEVNVVFRREGIKKPLERTILREMVVVNQVTWHGLVADQTGYINLSGFTGKATQEVRQALVDLRSKGAKRLILDLRNNGGGLLDEAVSICNLFVGKGQEIVSTRGKIKQWNRTYETTREPVDTVMPLVVLVNSGSASSSEIVCGALQDLDRAVVVGSRTFGKGLVQTTRSIPYNGVLKITTAKYYIPSGRCIQAIDYSNRNEDGSVGRIPDSLTHEFSTRAGRLVRDGGGIQPDVLCKDDRGSALTYALMDGMHFFDYANQYRRLHEKIPPVAEFKLTDADLADFLTFVKSRKFTYESESAKMLRRWKEVLDDEGLTGEVKPELEALEAKLNRDLDADFSTFREEVELMLSTEIVSRYYYQTGEAEQSLKFDPCLKKAVEVILDGDGHRKLLSRSIATN